MGTEIAATQEVSFERVQIRGLAFVVGFFFSFRLSIVLISVQVLGLEPSAGSALSLGLDCMLLGLVCFDSIGAGRRSIASILRLPAMRWVIAFLAFSCISLLWSETASLTDSLAYWLGLVIDVVNMILLLRSDSETNTACSLMKGFIWSSCLLALIAWIMPAQADLRLGDEQFFNTNEIANVCVFAIFFAQFLTRRNHESWRFAKFFLAITVLRSLSKSTLIAFLVSESLLLIFDRSMSRKAKVFLMTGALVLILSFWGLFEAYYDVYTTAGNQAETLTGRTAIWLYVFNAIFDHPWTLWIGHGFDSWWKVVPPFGNEMFEARHAENELLQQLYVFGVAGVVLLIGIYYSLFRQICKLERGREHGSVRALFISMLVFILVRGLAVADSFDLLLPLWCVVLISVIVDRGRVPGWNDAKVSFAA
jgi:exopolysaccharide production protein ExoQ